MIKPLHPETGRIQENNLEETLRPLDFFSKEAIKRALLLETAGRIRIDGGLLANAAENIELHSPGWSIPFDVLLEAAAGPPPDGGHELLSSSEDRELAVILAGSGIRHIPCAPSLRFIGLDDAKPWKPNETLLRQLAEQGVKLQGATATYFLHTSTDFQTRIQDPSHA